MASEVLSVPERHLADVINVIRAGLVYAKVPRDVYEGLRDWCNEQENYLLDIRETANGGEG